MRQDNHTPINGNSGQVAITHNYGSVSGHDHIHANGLFCETCCSKLCGSCEKVMLELLEKEKECERLYRLNAFKLGLYRLPALYITLFLELIGGIFINELDDSIKEFILLASFLPIISALSGNLGLQAASNTTRGLATGNIRIQDALKNMWKEVRAGLFSSFAIALTLAVIGGLWAGLNTKDIEEVYHREENRFYPLIFAMVIFAGTLLSMMVSSVNGALMPIFAHKCNVDPAKVAGPFETAFQDIIGQAFLLGFAKIILIPLFKSYGATTSIIPDELLNNNH